jgi:hypothetical protein
MRTAIGLGLALIREQIQALREWCSALAGTRVAIAYGGVSTEDRFYLTRSPASQLSITALTKEMGSLGVRATVLDPCQPSFLRSLLDFDVVMPNMHGPYGEDGRLQGMLDYIRKPYCCSGVAASAIAADKALCKLTMAGLASRRHLGDCQVRPARISGPSAMLSWSSRAWVAAASAWPWSGRTETLTKPLSVQRPPIR